MQSTNLTFHSQNQAAKPSGWAAYARWILVLVFVLGWAQSALVLPVQRTSLSETLNQGAALQAHPEGQARLSRSLPPIAVQPASEAELMDEDDDESGGSAAFQDEGEAPIPSFDETHYASVLRIRLHQLEAGMQMSAEVPRFIRFHSWKSDPS